MKRKITSLVKWLKWLIALILFGRVQKCLWGGKVKVLQIKLRLIMY